MATYRRQRYLFMSTDPVHVGTGGYRLGRVDNSIVREPGTRVPKIPGTSLHGAARSNAARLYENPAAAGRDHGKVDKPQGDPICYTFGYIQQADGSREEVRAYSGVVNIFDALVLAFPVYSMAGPVWISTYERLKEAGFRISNPEQGNKPEEWTPPENWEAGKVFLTWQRSDILNLGWLMMEVGGGVSVQAPSNWNNETRWKAIADHLVLVKESIFSQIVNSNLEVRTSVAIDPERGAAEEGALFTYEALPRATFLTAEVVLDDDRMDWPLKTEERQRKTFKDKALPGGCWNGPLAVVQSGLRLIEWLGVGGMGTRGFGRMAMIGDPVEETYGGRDGDAQPGDNS
ncbi:type III-B CRISPR module RAMP protein Cmr4 [Desulforamulus ruminis]|uniref:CRISPR-associated RAMP protein, Cmr4 family n=1 Tax=Desulforamulus ruminis (strain ATCC 23193 / DSM 2154 / NCIMB 8452 / DL) TaxID=696281 RepID=F6DMZ2_DESRL|nr:type III-B CRISPR module RAMP protein Cmr4 [Desulforamulus ruminis]AEG59450.1 CRISPR-associated RAMP protein, Cmr4 family [Desulforamulus ruminis DSM 2154]